MISRDLKSLLARRVKCGRKARKKKRSERCREIEEDFIIGPATRQELDRASSTAHFTGGNARTKDVSLEEIKERLGISHRMRIRFTGSGHTTRRLPHRLQKRIIEKVRFYSLQSDPLQFAEPLTGSNEYRFRIGDYRVIFEMLHDTLWVTAIKRRDEAYR